MSSKETALRKVDLKLTKKDETKSVLPFSQIKIREKAAIQITKRDLLLELTGKPIAIVEKQFGYLLRNPSNSGASAKISYVGEDFFMTEDGNMFSISHIVGISHLF